MAVKLTRLPLYVFLLLCLMMGSCKSGKRKSSHRGSSGKTALKKSKADKGATEKTNRTELTLSDIEKVISTARSYRGTPHRDGGTGRLGIDCSALIQVSYQAVGFNLPRTSKEQSMIGREVTLSQIRPGDLVFFADKKVGNGITHVGMVTEINGKDEIKFIHTSSKLGVTENLLSSAYFKNTFVKAMRPYQ